MANVVIDDSNLYAIGDALRGKLGATHKGMVTEIVHHPEIVQDMVKVAKTPNATGFETRDGDYDNNMSDYQVITIPGATTIRVNFAYQTENVNYDFLQIAAGDYSGQTMPSDSDKFGGYSSVIVTYNRTYDGDTVTFYFQSDSSKGTYLGYYAEVTGTDAEGNTIQEITPAWDEEVEVEADIPNTYKPRDMAAAIESIEAGAQGNFANIGGLLTTTYEGSYYSYTYLPTDIESNKLYLHVTMHPAASSLITRSYSGIDSSLIQLRKYTSYATTTLVPTTAITGTAPSIYSNSGSSSSTYKCIHDVVAPISNIDVNSIVMEDASFSRKTGEATIEINPDYADYKKIIVIIKGGHERANTSFINDTKFYPIEEDCGFKRLSPTITGKSLHASYHHYLGVAILYQDADTHADTFTITVPQSDNNGSNLYGHIIYYKTPEEDS